MSGTHVTRGDAGRGYELACRTRECIGKNTGLNRFKFDYLQIFSTMFNFRFIITLTLNAVCLCI